jgi:hypothetical protein
VEFELLLESSVLDLEIGIDGDEIAIRDLHGSVSIFHLPSRSNRVITRSHHHADLITCIGTWPEKHNEDLLPNFSLGSSAGVSVIKDGALAWVFVAPGDLPIKIAHWSDRKEVVVLYQSNSIRIFDIFHHRLLFETRPSFPVHDILPQPNHDTQFAAAEDLTSTPSFLITAGFNEKLQGLVLFWDLQIGSPIQYIQFQDW